MTLVNLQTQFKKEIAPKLQKDLGLKNMNAVPKIKKITISVKIGSLTQKLGKDYSYVVDNLGKIAGQKAVVTKARKAISNFKLREGAPVGVMVTLRGKRMYDFLSKLVNITLPRVRDFRGISTKSFDGNGNYSLGMKEHIVFPEINPDDVLHLHGVEITINTTAKNDKDGLALLKAFNFPFKAN
jgi:large subunit ribosomal protein L5